MKWSFKIGEFAGIGVFIHATFFLLIGWVLLVHWSASRSLTASLSGVGFVLALFVCVVLHEYGHALTARRYGIKTRDITLLPIGGLARLERMPDKPRQELWVALAGPAVNVVIAGLLFGWLQLTGAMEPLTRLGVARGGFVERLMMVNVILVVFNMLPAFPMDGGRVLRALLATRLSYVRATQIAAAVGQGMALLFGFLGLFTNPFLLFIALFVWIGAGQEASFAQMKTALNGITVRDTMITDFQHLHEAHTLAHVVDLILQGSQQDFPVLSDAGDISGVLTRGALLKALAQADQAAPVSSVMSRDFRTADEEEMLESAVVQLQESECKTLPVLRRGQLVGLLTMDNVGEFLMIQAALDAKRARQATDAA